MIRRFLLSLLVLVGLCAMPMTAVAATDVLDPVCKNAGNAPAVCKDNATGATSNPILGPDGIMTRVVQILVIILGIISVFVIIIAGLRIVASNGDTNTVATMQKAIIAAVAGLAVAAVSQGIVTLLLSKL